MTVGVFGRPDAHVIPPDCNEGERRCLVNMMDTCVGGHFGTISYCSDYCDPVEGCVGAMENVDSYIWIANTGEGTLSKVNTRNTEEVARYPELKVFSNEAEIPEKLYETDPDKCCEILKVQPVRDAVKTMKVSCWMTGLRCTEGRTRTNYKEVEELDKGLIKLNPILIWYEREVWQYLALNKVPVNPLYLEGYRSLGCSPCTHIAQGADERAGRWIGTSKCGGECGIHTRPLLDYQI